MGLISNKINKASLIREIGIKASSFAPRKTRGFFHSTRNIFK